MKCNCGKLFPKEVFEEKGEKSLGSANEGLKCSGRLENEYDKNAIQILYFHWIITESKHDGLELLEQKLFKTNIFSNTIVYSNTIFPLNNYWI